MNLVLKQSLIEALEPLGAKAAEFFLAASLYHAHKVSFAAAAAMADLNFEEFAYRLREHFDSGFRVEDEAVEEDLLLVDRLVKQS
jgi:predicted HTH domain antitoxin